MKNFVAVLLTLSLVVLSLPVANCFAQDATQRSMQLESDASLIPTAEERKALGRKLFEFETQRLSSILIPIYSAAIEEAKSKLDVLESRNEQNRYELRMMNRNRPGFGASLGQMLMHGPNQAGLMAMIDLIDTDINTIKARVKQTEDIRDIHFPKLVWFCLTHYQRLQILESGCLSDVEREGFLEVQSVPDISRIPSFDNSVGLRFRLIPAGSFRFLSKNAGSSKSDESATSISLTAPFWMAEMEVHQPVFQKIMGKNPSSFQASEVEDANGAKRIEVFPVENVTWFEAVRFCVNLSKQESEQELHRSYRLPTEAEWEYARRAGADSNIGDGVSGNVEISKPKMDLAKAVFDPTLITARVGQFPPSEFGLFEMQGNVSEWCSDWYDKNYFRSAKLQDPPGPDAGSMHDDHDDDAVPSFPEPETKVYCGKTESSELTETIPRLSIAPDRRDSIGIRVVCEIGEPSAIALRQYKELEDYDAVKPRKAYIMALDKHFNELTRRKTLLEQTPQFGETCKEKWYVKTIASNRKYLVLKGLYQASAKSFEMAKDQTHAKKDYLSAALFGEGHIAVLREESKDYKVENELPDLVNAAELYQNGGDYDRVQEIIDYVRNEDPRLAVNLEIRQRSEKK